MITQIEGKLVEKNPAFVVIECSGLGYLVNVSLNTYSKISDINIGAQCKLFTHFSIQENVHTGETIQSLYGFFDVQERMLFRHLISVSGISASKAKMILSTLSPDETQRAILLGDLRTLSSVKGIGPKVAERIVAELRSKLGKEEFASDSTSISSSTNKNKEEALFALTSLGFDKISVQKVLRKVIDEKGTDLPVEEFVKAALKHL